MRTRYLSSNLLLFLGLLLLWAPESSARVINLVNFTTPIVSNDKILATDSSTEERLLRFLFRDYNPHIMPRQNLNESFKLYIGLAMSQLINIYDKEQVMKTNVWLHMWWMDPFLQWSHIQEYKHIMSIRVPHDKVWTPDIILFNNAHGKYDVSYKSNVVLYQQGGLLWIPPAIYKSSCQINVRYFPFDQQICEMIFGSWVYNSEELTLDYFENMRNVDLHDYVPSGTWGLIEVPASIEFYSDTNTNKTKTQMVYKIKMRRKSRFYIVNIIIPTFLLSFLSVCVFYLPTDDGEKITLSLSILFALVVFFLLIAKIIPPTSIVVPLISKYLLFTFIMNILSVLNTCIVINLYYKRLSLDHLHPWLHWIFLRLMPRVLFLNRNKKATAAATRERLASISVSAASVSQHLQKSKLFKIPPASSLPRRPSPESNLDAMCRDMSSSQRRVEFEDYQKTVRKFDSNNDLLLVSSTTDLEASSNRLGGQHVILRARDSDVIAVERSVGQLESSRRSKGQLAKSNLYNIDKFVRGSSGLKRRRNMGESSESMRMVGERSFEKREMDEDTMSQKSTAAKPVSIDTIQLTERFLSVCRSVDYIANIMKAKAQLDEIKEDWKFIASILDRLMLIIFFVVTCFGTYWFLFDAPHLFEQVDEQNLIKMNSHKLVNSAMGLH